ncbi:hypothetical protein FGRMN_6884 [Fusarium graminum]|nr:hypothetical protein FGRMN_6884 [Fusarium graminum]
MMQAVTRVQQIEVYEDNIEGTQLIYWSGEAHCGDEIIWFQNMLAPGSIADIKRALWNGISDEEKKEFRQATKGDYTRLQKGMNPMGVTRPFLTTQAQHLKPLICRPIHTGINYDRLHYRLRWPPIALLDFPTKMIQALKHFLGVHQEDNISLNIALAATVIYFDMYHHDGPDESFTAQDSAFDLKKKRLPPLGTFIVYFPHMLRFVEVKHLTAFINPSRFAATNVANDYSETSPEIPASRFIIKNREIDTRAMRECYYDIRSRHPQVCTDVRFTLIPASMPGTELFFPPDCKDAEPPSIDLFTICCLDNVRALGLPSYHHTNVYVDSAKDGHHFERSEHFRHIAGPEWLFSQTIRPSVYHLKGTPSDCYWRPKGKTKFMSLTNEAREVGPIFPDYGSDHWDSQAVAECVERRFGLLTAYTEDMDLRNDLAEFRRKVKASRNDEIIRIALYLGVAPSEWYTDPETLYLTWEGMEEQLLALLESGDLKKVASGELKRNVDDGLKRAATAERPAPPAKKNKTAYKRIGSTTKAKILSIIDRLPVRSLDWDMALKYLNSRPKPAKTLVQDLLSDVQSFVSDIEDAFRSENAENGQGDLSQVIRMAFRAAGFFDETSIAALDLDHNWSEYRERLSKFGQALVNAVEVIYRLRHVAGGFALTLPNIQVLRESPMVSAQVDAYKEIDALLKEDGAVTPE